MIGRVAQSLLFKGMHSDEGEPSRKVLILGGGEYGIKIAQVLKNNHIESTLLTGLNEKFPLNPSVESIQGSIRDVTGFAGNFIVRIDTGEKITEFRFGFIIAAQPPDRKSKVDAFQIVKSDSIFNLSEFRDYLNSGGALPERKDGWIHIAFFIDLMGSADVSQFETLNSILDRLESVDRLQCYVFTRNLKVAANGLESSYRYHRQRGVVFFKFDDEVPAINQDKNGATITFFEPLLREEMELTPDVMVFDEILGTPDSLKPLFDLIPSAAAFITYLQPDSSRFQGVETPKAGIYAVGAARGAFDLEALNADVEAATVSIMKASREKSFAQNHDYAMVDSSKCTFCLTCVRLCPHGAIGFASRPLIDRFSCRACGICAAECPQEAIEIFSVESKSLCDSTDSKPFKLVVCANSGLQAVAKIDSGTLSDVEIISIQCAGKLNTSMVLEYFRDGARGVIVAGCFKGNCASIYGSTLAQRRIDYVSQILDHAGFEPEGLEFISVAGNTPEIISEAIMKMKNRIARN